MKRVSNLYDKIISIENLMLADEKARKGKHSRQIKQFDLNRELNIYDLHLMLKNKTYHTSKYNIFTVFEPKERLIYSLPYYPDRIVHHAILNILEPIWVKTFTYNTYSCIKERGIEACAKQVRKILNKYKDKKIYCLKIDIKKFYPSIDHDVLKSIIRKKIKDKNLLWLLDEIIDSTDGIPIGNYLSQFFANLMLCYTMHKLNTIKDIMITEYADDICMFSNHRILLYYALEILKEDLTNLKLQLKSNYLLFPIALNKYDKHGRAVDYVGYKFYINQLLLRKRIKYNICKTVSKIRNKKLYDIKLILSPYLGWIKHSNSKNLIKRLLNNSYNNIIKLKAK